MSSYLFFHNGSDLYGASRSLLRLAARLVQDGHQVAAVLPESGRLGPELETVGVEVIATHWNLSVSRGNMTSFIWGLHFLFSLIPALLFHLCLLKKMRPDIVHTNTALMFFPALASKWCGIPHIWHIRESFAEFDRLWPKYERYMAWGSNRIVAVSRAIAAQFSPRSSSKVVVLHNGFPAAEFNAVPLERVDAFRARYGLGKAVLVGVVGRIKFGRKGQEVFVHAASLLKPEFPDVRFLVVGSPFPGNEEHGARLQQLIQDLGLEQEVVCTGDVEDVKAMYAALDISVMASGTPEPFGGVVVESMAMSKPVVGTNIGGTSEQILDGATGFLIPPEDASTMADALRKLFVDEDLKCAMGKRGRLRFESCFEFEEFYRKMNELYRQEIA